jgi:hypothetical protein
MMTPSAEAAFATTGRSREKSAAKFIFPSLSSFTACRFALAYFETMSRRSLPPLSNSVTVYVATGTGGFGSTTLLAQIAYLGPAPGLVAGFMQVMLFGLRDQQPLS